MSEEIPLEAIRQLANRNLPGVYGITKHQFDALMKAIGTFRYKLVPIANCEPNTEMARSGGIARAKALSQERRTEIAKQAAAARWKR